MSQKVTHLPGRFIDDGRTFEITDVALEGVWDHYLSNDCYCMVLSQTWCGYSFYRARPFYPVSISGRFAFIRDLDSQEAWPVNEPVACPGQLPMYERLHGLTGDESTGSARFRTSLDVPPLTMPTESLMVQWGQGFAGMTNLRDGIKVQMRLMVASDDPVELWDISVENVSQNKRRIALMPTLNFHLGAGIAMAGNANVCSFTEIDKANRSIIARMEGIRKSGYDNIVGILASVDGPAPDGYFGTLDSAQEALLNNEAPDAHAMGEEAVAMLRIPLVLAPGQKVSCSFIVGVANTAKDAKRLAARYRPSRARAGEAKKIEEFWNSIAQRQVIETPDKQLDRFFNSWLKYEMVQTGRWCRGEGRGYRDVLQDSEGMGLLDDAMPPAMIESCLVRQRSDGWAVREFDGVLPGSRSVRDFRDSALWIVYALDTLLREGGGLGFLWRKMPFLDKGAATVLEHAFGACKYLMTHCGKHRLPLIAGGDWNDALDQAGTGGKGESVWLGIALIRAMSMLADICMRACERRGATPAQKRLCRKMVSQFAKWRPVMEKAVQGPGWDGQWYRRAFDDNGRVLGGKQCREGKLFLLPQAWAAFSGLGDADRIEKGLLAVEKHLASAYGYAKSWPGYTKRDMNIGRITVRAAGLGENAGIQTHAVTFKVKADFALGRGTLAYQTLQKLMPIDGHTVGVVPAEPPYTLVNQRVGPEHQDFGSHKNRWLSGCVPWIFRLIAEDMMGAKADVDGLRIAPCLPADWTQCRIERTFRGAVYDIHITKPKGIQRGRVKLTLDGKSVEGNLLPVMKKGTRHRVECVVE